jgi:hypothetical protein
MSDSKGAHSCYIYLFTLVLWILEYKDKSSSIQTGHSTKSRKQKLMDKELSYESDTFSLS